MRNFILIDMRLKQGQIVLVSFPFSDLTSVKTRPALVVSNSTLKGDDFVLCAITSCPGGGVRINLSNKSLIKGRLPVQSYIRADKIMSLHQTIIKKIVAEVSYRKKVEVFKKLKELVSVKNPAFL